MILNHVWKILAHEVQWWLDESGGDSSKGVLISLRDPHLLVRKRVMDTSLLVYVQDYWRFQTRLLWSGKFKFKFTHQTLQNMQKYKHMAKFMQLFPPLLKILLSPNTNYLLLAII